MKSRRTRNRKKHDLLRRLPSQLIVDASRRSEAGIRISLPLKPPRPPLQPRIVEPDEPAAVYQIRSPTPMVAERPIRPYGAGWAIPNAAESPADALRSLEYVVVDVETTGGSFRGGHRVTEVAAVRVDGDGRPIAEFGTLVNPRRSIPPFIAALTSITYEMVQDAPLFEDIAAPLRDFLAGAVFVAHNASFDWRFLRDELAAADGRPLHGRVLCTVRLARRVVPELSHRSLDALQWFFAVDNEARHRAYGDARATAQIFRRLLDRIDDREIACWHDLETLLARRAARRRHRGPAMPTSIADI
jgi:DNA polymerase III subunit epsilon